MHKIKSSISVVLSLVHSVKLHLTALPICDNHLSAKESDVFKLADEHC